MQALRVTDDQAAYALIRARIELRLVELREALDRHEADWRRVQDLERVERGLAELAREVGET